MRVNAETADASKATALHLAVRAASIPVLRALLELPTSHDAINAADLHKDAPLHLALRAAAEAQPSLECALVLLKGKQLPDQHSFFAFRLKP